MTLHEFNITFVILQLLYNHVLIDRAAGSNHRGPNSIPGRAEHLFVNSSKILKLLLKTNDGKDGTPDWDIMSTTYASAKFRVREGQLLLTQCLLYLITLFISHH